MALSRQHHGELNGVMVIGTKAGRYNELRTQYADDPVALQEIDAYDGSSYYNLKLREYISALKMNDEQAIKELELWFNKYYPDIGR